jgi:hypothetical protein
MATSRVYGLFEKKPGEKRWTRLDSLRFGLRLEYARRHWQDALINGALIGRNIALRPIQLPKDSELA